MQYTSNYNLKKPELTDPADIRDLNENADTIDGKLYELETTKRDITDSQLITKVSLESLGLTDNDLALNNEESTFSTILGAIGDNTKIIIDVRSSSTPKLRSCCKNRSGSLFLNKIVQDRVTIKFCDLLDSTETYYSAYNSGATPKFRGWKLMTTEDGGTFIGNIAVEKTSGEASITAKSTTANNSILPYANDTGIGLRGALSGVIRDLFNVSSTDDRRADSDLRSIYLDGRRVTKNNGYSLNSNGYMKLELDEGKTIIVQWGIAPAGAHEETLIVSFPITFPNNVFNILLTQKRKGAYISGTIVSYAELNDNSSFFMTNDNYGTTATFPKFWVAIGY